MQHIVFNFLFPNEIMNQEIYYINPNVDIFISHILQIMDPLSNIQINILPKPTVCQKKIINNKIFNHDSKNITLFNFQIVDWIKNEIKKKMQFVNDFVNDNADESRLCDGIIIFFPTNCDQININITNLPDVHEEKLFILYQSIDGYHFGLYIHSNAFLSLHNLLTCSIHFDIIDTIKNNYKYDTVISDPIYIDSLYKIIYDHIDNNTHYSSDSIINNIFTQKNNSDKSLENLTHLHNYSKLSKQIFKYIINNSVVPSKNIITDQHITIINNHLMENNISLRQLFFLNNALPFIDHDSFIDSIKSVISDHNVLTVILNYFPINKTKINIYKDFLCFIEQEKPFCFIIPTYNGKTFFKENLDSVYRQQYINYRIILIDDCSDNIKADDICQYVNENKQQKRTLIQSQYIRQKQCAGRYIGYHQTNDDEIIILLDGDDELYGDNCLSHLNDVYSKNNVMCTFGSYFDKFNGNISTNFVGDFDYDQKTKNNRDYRKRNYTPTHLRTCYSKLLKMIKLRDLLFVDGKFFHIMTDDAEFFPVLEMSNGCHQNIKKPLAIYNRDNSSQYLTSRMLVNEKNNDYYRKYRNDANELIKNNSKYSVLQFDSIFSWRTQKQNDIKLHIFDCGDPGNRFIPEIDFPIELSFHVIKSNDIMVSIRDCTYNFFNFQTDSDYALIMTSQAGDDCDIKTVFNEIIDLINKTKADVITDSIFFEDKDKGRSFISGKFISHQEYSPKYISHFIVDRMDIIKILNHTGWVILNINRFIANELYLFAYLKKNEINIY
jgi:glycosyltransferase involved in cell wall biosynthesis